MYEIRIQTRPPANDPLGGNPAGQYRTYAEAAAAVAAREHNLDRQLAANGEGAHHLTLAQAIIEIGTGEQGISWHAYCPAASAASPPA
jgi:hypothetical protein